MEVNVKSGRCVRLTPSGPVERAPLPFACVYSPDGQRIAFMRPVAADGKVWNQIFCVNSKRP